jgi:SOS-response transcriptional repressor LexA
MEKNLIPWTVIAQKLKDLGRKPAWLATQLRTGTNTTSNWKSRGGAPLDRAREIAAILECSTDDLLLSPPETKHDSTDDDQSKKEQKSGMISELAQQQIINMGSEPREKFDANAEFIEPTWHRVPLISHVQAGMMTEAVDPFSLGDGFEIVLTHIPVSPRTFALRIKGESMLPKYNPGDVVIIDPEVAPQAGDMVVAKNTEEEATFKKYRPRGTNERGEMTFELVPLNEDFATLHSERDHLHIIGVEIEHRTFRRPR